MVGVIEVGTLCIYRNKLHEKHSVRLNLSVGHSGGQNGISPVHGDATIKQIGLMVALYMFLKVVVVNHHTARLIVASF